MIRLHERCCGLITRLAAERGRSTSMLRLTWHRVRSCSLRQRAREVCRPFSARIALQNFANCLGACRCANVKNLRALEDVEREFRGKIFVLLRLVQAAMAKHPELDSIRVYFPAVDVMGTRVHLRAEVADDRWAPTASLHSSHSAVLTDSIISVIRLDQWSQRGYL